jgi:hypothetical protein
LGCNTLGFPEITKCTIINKDVAECVNKKEIYDFDVKKMRAYQCISPRDYGEVTKYIDKLYELIQEKL